MPGRAEGQSRVFWEGDTLTLQLEGHFNVEGVTASNNKIKAEISRLKPKVWQLHIQLSEDGLLTYESIPVVQAFFRWAKNHRCSDVLFTAKCDMQKQIVHTIMLDQGIAYKFLD